MLSCILAGISIYAYIITNALDSQNNVRYQNTDAQIIGITLSTPFLRPTNFSDFSFLVFRFCLFAYFLNF